MSNKVCWNIYLEEYITSYLRNGDDTTDDRDDDVNQLLKLNVDCLYYDIDDIAKLIIPGHNHKYTEIHLRIVNIPSKYFIIMCEIYLSDITINMFPLPRYQVVGYNLTPCSISYTNMAKLITQIYYRLMKYFFILQLNWPTHVIVVMLFWRSNQTFGAQWMKHVSNIRC